MTAIETIVVDQNRPPEAHAAAIEDFYGRCRPLYATQDFSVLAEWYKAFSSRGTVPTASRRGINFYGSTSYLEKMCFLLMRKNGEAVAFIPLFQFRVDLRGVCKGLKVYSLCPDSGLFFYNDFLIDSVHADAVFNELAGFIEKTCKKEESVFLLNHLPDFSPLKGKRPQFLSAAEDRQLYTLASPVGWRGGAYPWNIAAYKTILNRIHAHKRDVTPELYALVAETLSMIESTTQAFLLFDKQRRAIDEQIDKIIAHDASDSMEVRQPMDQLRYLAHDHVIQYPYIELPNSVDAFNNRLSSSKRYYFGRYTRKFLAAGGEFVRFQGDEITKDAIDAFIGLHQARWSEDSGIVKPQTIDFLHTLFSRLANLKTLTLFFALLNDKKIATLACMDFSGRRIFVSSGRDPDYDRSRAGKLLLLHAIVDSIEQNFEIFDLGYGADPYKYELTDEAATASSIYISTHQNAHLCDHLFQMHETLLKMQR